MTSYPALRQLTDRNLLPKGEGKKCRNFGPLPRGEGGPSADGPGEGSLASNLAEKPDSRSQVSNLKRSGVAGSLLLSAIYLIGFHTRGWAQETVPTRVDVYWQQSTTLRIPSVSQVVVLDESICRAEVSEDKVTFFGLNRGESVALVWTSDGRLSLLVRVVMEPAKLPPPTLRQAADDGAIHGLYGSSLQGTSGSGSASSYMFAQRLSWRQDLQGGRLTIQAQVQDQTGAGTPVFNLNTASVVYSTPRYNLSLIDTIVGMNGGFQAQVVPNSGVVNSLLIRGAEIQFRQGKNEYGFFGGTTVPATYLDLSATRDVIGFNFARQESPRLYLYATTAGTNVPFLIAGGAYRRQTDAFQTAGFAFHLNDHWAFQSSGGICTSGAMAQAAVLYSGARGTAYVSAMRSSPDFPLNQLQLFVGGQSSVTAGATAQLNGRVTGGVFYQHASAQPNPLFTSPATSDYLSPNLNVVLSERERLTFYYTLTRNRGGLGAANQTTGHRADFQLSSQIIPRLGNSAELVLGSLSDPLQLNATTQFSIRDALNFQLPRGNTLFLTFSRDRTDPSLVNRLSSELGLLSPALQELFLLNPLAFVDSPNLPTEIRTLLSNLQPTNTQVSLSGQFVIRQRLNFSPQVGYFHTAKSAVGSSNSHTFGYTLAYQLTPRWQLQSSLSNVLLWDSAQQGLRRDTVFSAGFNVALRSAPHWLMPYHAHRGAIRGRVYKDLNINGAFNAGEPGFPGVRVDLSDGQSVLTDSEGRFEFSGLSPDVYRVSLGLVQFKVPVRVTSPTEVSVSLSGLRTAEVDFGIINFSRVQGNVFNDYLVNGDRQPDAPPVPGVRLVLTAGESSRDVITDGSGDFEFDELNPGEYKLALDPATIPPNFISSGTARDLHIEPNSTVVEDFPLQALRSISGQVVLKTTASTKLPGSQPVVQPVANAKIALAGRVVTTDEQGRFVLRNLPAGHWVLETVAWSPAPEGVKMPSGLVDLPREPVQVQGAAIVISNPGLLEYLVPPDGQPRPATGGSR